VFLQGKTALITGGAAGIGKGIALYLATAGADVVIADLDEQAAMAAAAQVTALGRHSHAVPVDVSRRDQVEAMLATAWAAAPLDILVNNAGVEHITPLLEVGEDEWDRVLAVNLKGTFLCSQAFARRLVDAGRPGKIVNIGSIAGFTPPRHEPHYGASKGGVHALTRQLALDLAPHHINVNAVAPGVVRNGLSTRHSLADAERARRLGQQIPWGRVGTPQDIGAAVAFLASEMADYITGVVLTVDGGYLLATL
jgi:NAD(P)-dependent dehydrogenase (short-subunit alcohol dehydrogenase family)